MHPKDNDENKTKRIQRHLVDTVSQQALFLHIFLIKKPFDAYKKQRGGGRGTITSFTVFNPSFEAYKCRCL